MDEIENYQVTSIIGSGSFGTCYKVKHLVSLNEYVWKAVNYGSMNEDKKQLLVSEVNLLSKLRHPNIVQYFNHIIHQKSSTLYIIMEWCNGGDLANIIKHCVASAQYLNELFLWRILYQIGSALDVCHSQCSRTVLHRDIKPANIFLDGECNVKLGDFGLAKILEDKQQFTDTVVGSPFYMSPEVVAKQKYNQKTDIWSLGCLMYETSSLAPPFIAEDMQHLSLKIKHGQFRRIPNHYTDELQTMIRFMLSTNSDSRPSIDAILRHPTVLSKANKHIKSIYTAKHITTNCNHKYNKTASIQDDTNKLDDKENLNVRIENVRNRETAIHVREEHLKEKERNLIKREKKITIMERLASEKIARANLYLKRSKEKPLHFKSKAPAAELLDTSYSAADNSILPSTSMKINEELIVKPKGFMRSKSERRVHFNAQRRVFESNNDQEVFIKEYNLFNEQNHHSSKNKKEKHGGFGGFGRVLKTLNNKLSSQSDCTSTSSNASRPISWTEENKKCAFTLLKIMNAESDKENVHSDITHTRM